MKTNKPFMPHLKSAADLVTPYEAVRAGFVALALEKNRKATPYVAQARTLQVLAAKAKRPADLLRIEDIQPALLTASGLSDKAIGHLTVQHKKDAVDGLIQNFLEPAGTNFVEELVFRFLLTRGDTLGGSMRNIGGALAQRKLARSILSYLSLSGTSYHWLHSNKDVWFDQSREDSDVELNLRGISWSAKRKHRTLLFNVTIPATRNNIDIVMLSCAHSDILSKRDYSEMIGNPDAYIALGELKGGIDPAGADEHWKTARTALARIEKAFKKMQRTPALLFVGAAIAPQMANEIWALLQEGTLETAGNLTNENHVTAIVKWLFRL